MVDKVTELKRKKSNKPAPRVDLAQELATDSDAFVVLGITAEKIQSNPDAVAFFEKINSLHSLFRQEAKKLAVQHNLVMHVRSVMNFG